MSISQMSDDLNIISALSDEPNATDGLTATQLKAKFDEASGLIKSYVNGTLVPAINSSLPEGQYASDAGSTDSYAITLDPVPTAYVTGMIYRFKANTANTGACTVNVNSLGAKTIKKNVSDDMETGDILVNQMVEVEYDGTNMQIISASSELKFHKVEKAPHTVPTCRIFNNASQAIANDTLTALAFNSDLYDTDSMHDLVTNTSRITINTAGKYSLTAIIEFASNGTGVREVFLKVNNSIFISQVNMQALTSTTTIIVASCDYNFVVNDYVEVFVYQNSGGSLNVTASNANNKCRCEFMAHLISK